MKSSKILFQADNSNSLTLNKVIAGKVGHQHHHMRGDHHRHGEHHDFEEHHAYEEHHN